MSDEELKKDLVNWIESYGGWLESHGDTRTKQVLMDKIPRLLNIFKCEKKRVIKEVLKKLNCLWDEHQDYSLVVTNLELWLNELLEVEEK